MAISLDFVSFFPFRIFCPFLIEPRESNIGLMAGMTKKCARGAHDSSESFLSGNNHAPGQPAARACKESVCHRIIDIVPYLGRSWLLTPMDIASKYHRRYD